jgi:hypothetical protein
MRTWRTGATIRRVNRLTALAPLSIAAVLALVPAAGAQGVGTPQSTVVAPTARIVATGQPVPVDLTLIWPGADLDNYTYSARVAVAPDPAPRDVVDGFPLTADPANPAHVTGTASDGVNDTRWASRPGTYFIGVEADYKNTGASCTTDPATGAITCAEASLPVLQERPLHEVVVVPRLTAIAAKSAARRRAGRIGWRATAPLVCTAPYVPSAYACTFTWHTGTHVRKTVRRSLIVAQDATGAITITRTAS